MFSIEILTALNVPSVQSTVDYYTDSNDAYVPAIIYGSLLPENITAEKTINFYTLAPIRAIPYIDTTLSVSCRAKTQGQAETIQFAVYNATHEKSFTGYFLTAQMEQILTPQDETDNYNAPVTIRIKKRGF